MLEGDDANMTFESDIFEGDDADMVFESDNGNMMFECANVHYFGSEANGSRKV